MAEVSAVIGIDPGGKTTAIVVLTGDGEFVIGDHVHRPEGGDLNAYGLEVADFAHSIVAPYSSATGGPIVAVEQINRPNPHKNRRDRAGDTTSIINPQGAMDTSRIIGVLLVALFPYCIGDLRMVPPKRHGKASLDQYPAALVGPRETAGTGILRHQRAAFDIANYCHTRLPRGEAF